MLCAICEVRKPRRFCPGVRGDICSICCGTEREVTVSCPFECPYLQDARQHERTPPADPDQFPNRDIRVTDDFLHEHEPLLIATARGVLQAAVETPGAVDTDVRESLEALIRTYRTLQSGVYYESRPPNPLANHIFEMVQERVAHFREQETKELGLTRTRDADVMGVLAFLQRMELDRHNGRARGRAFLDFLRQFFPQAPGEPVPATSSLIIP